MNKTFREQLEVILDESASDYSMDQNGPEGETWTDEEAWFKDLARSIDRITSLVERLIGEDEPRSKHHDCDICWLSERNVLRAELRTKLKQ